MKIEIKGKTYDLYQSIPQGWKVDGGNAPRGYILICNNKSRFGGERKIGLISADDYFRGEKND